LDRGQQTLIFLRALRGLAHLRDVRQEHPDQNRDYRDNNQEFDERESVMGAILAPG
jgi:hypothetical protein